MKIRSETRSAWSDWFADFGGEDQPWCLLEEGGTAILEEPTGMRHVLSDPPSRSPRLLDGRIVTATDRGAGLALRVGELVLPRCVPREGEEYRVPPVTDLESLRRRAAAESGSVPLGRPDAAQLVEAVTIDSRLRLDLRYATAANFVGAPVYSAARCFLQAPAARALRNVVQRLASDGLGLVIFDAYRPWRVTWLFREVTPPEQHRYVADPATGSRHNRGCAIDLTLCDLETGRLLPMPSGFDEFSHRAHADYRGGTSERRENRSQLRAVMESAGFSMYRFEWWHFDHENWEEFPLFDLALDEIVGHVLPLE